MTSPCRKYVIFALLGVVLAIDAVPVKKNVTIAKCCALDELLTSDYKCLKSLNSSWDVNIYVGSELKPFVGSLPPRWVVKERTQPQCTETVIEHLDKKTLIPFINGYMMSLTYEKQIFPKNFCLDYEYAIYCRPDGPPGQITHPPLVKKCCGKDAIFSETNSSCFLLKDPSYDIDIGQNNSVGAGFPACRLKNESVVAGKFHEAALTSNGSLWINSSQVLLPPANFCLEHIFEQAGGGSPSIITCRNYVSARQLESSVKHTIYPVGLAISAIFLAATLAAGSLLPATHHVLHWRCQTNHVACLLVGDVLLCVAQIGVARFDYWPCFTIAVAIHFLFLAAFFWLNTMCFNIWWTFRDLRPQSTEKSQERLRLYLYEAYAWGVPLIIVFIGALADLVGTDESFLRPKFAVNQCWFAGNNEILTYFFGPMGTLMVINLILFGLTARELTCGLWKRELVKSTTERAALGRVCAKLVVVMGVSWIMDVVSWLIGGPDYLWYFTDIINCLQGVFIFIVVGCQPQVLSAVKRSWCALRNRDGGGLGTTNQDHHSSSSHGLPSVGGDTLTTNNSTATNTAKSDRQNGIPLETNC